MPQAEEGRGLQQARLLLLVLLLLLLVLVLLLVLLLLLLLLVLVLVLALALVLLRICGRGWRRADYRASRLLSPPVWASPRSKT